MNCNCLVAFAFVAVVAPATRSDLPSLPVSRAPFEQSADVARRPTTLATWPFHPPAGWNLLGEERLTTWAEFRSGDKFSGPSADDPLQSSGILGPVVFECCQDNHRKPHPKGKMQ